MSRFHIFDPPDPMDRPLCSNFGWTMWIAHGGPDESDHDKRTIERHGHDEPENKSIKQE